MALELQEKCFSSKLRIAKFLVQLDTKKIGYILPQNIKKFGNGLRIEEGINAVTESYVAWLEKSKVAAHKGKYHIAELVSVNDFSKLPCIQRHDFAPFCPPNDPWGPNGESPHDHGFFERTGCDSYTHLVCVRTAMPIVFDFRGHLGRSREKDFVAFRHRFLSP